VLEGLADGVIQQHNYGDVYIDARERPVDVVFEEWSRDQARRQSRGGAGIDRFTTRRGP
jgi:hypothetical protein